MGILYIIFNGIQGKFYAHIYGPVHILLLLINKIRITIKSKLVFFIFESILVIQRNFIALLFLKLFFISKLVYFNTIIQFQIKVSCRHQVRQTFLCKNYSITISKNFVAQAIYSPFGHIITNGCIIELISRFGHGPNASFGYDNNIFIID